MSLPHSGDEASLESNTTREEIQIGDLFDAAALAQGLLVPDHLKTKRRRWLVLLLVSVSGGCAAGPIMSWPTLEPILMKESVFQGPNQMDNLAEVFSITSAVAMGTAMVSGVLYDTFGPRWCGAVGGFGCAACLVCMAIAVKVRSMNWLLWIAYPACSFFGIMNSNACYAWYWLLPENQNTVAGVVASIQLLSDSFCLLAVVLHNDYGVGMPSYFLLVGGLASLAAVIAYWFVPTFDENTATSVAIIEYTKSFETPRGEQDQIIANKESSYGSLGDGGEAGDMHKAPSTEQSAASSSALSQAKANLADTFMWLRLKTKVNILFCLYVVMNYLWGCYPQINMLQLYTGLLGPRDAHRLVDVWGGVMPVASVIFVLSMGPFVDKVGYTETIALLLVPGIVLTCLYSVQSYGVQCVAQVLLAGLANSVQVLAPRFCLYYAPAQIFGTVNGVQGTVIGLSQAVGTPLSTFVGNFFAEYLKGFSRYSLSVIFWGIMYFISTVVLLIYWRYNPLPAVGSCSMQEIREERCKISGNDDEDCPDAHQKIRKVKQDRCYEKGGLSA